MNISRRTTLGPISANQMNQMSSRASIGTRDNIAKPSAAPNARRASMSFSQPLSQPSASQLLAGSSMPLSQPGGGSQGHQQQSQSSSQQQQHMVTNNNMNMNMNMSNAVSRRSSIGPARKSSIPAKASVGMSGTRVALQDPRNISDKHFVRNGIETLTEYLQQHGYDIGKAVLTRPSTKDFNNIVNFLFKQIDPNFSTAGKFEDDFMTMMKFLNYPFQIAKSTITAAGSPHAWPSMLAILLWLVELLSYDEAVAQQKEQEEYELGSQGGYGNAASMDEDGEKDLDDLASEKAFNNYLRNAYSLFMTEKDEDYEVLQGQFLGSFDEKNANLLRQVEEIERQNSSLELEIKEVERKVVYLPHLRDKKRDLLDDLGNFEKLVNQLTGHKEQLYSKIESRKLESDKIQSMIFSAQQEIDIFRSKVNSQELSIDDVRQMTSDKARLEKEAAEASEKREQLERRVWETETSLRDKVQALEDSSRAYNIIAEELKLIPVTAVNSQGKDLKIEVDIRSKKKTGLLKTDVRNEVLPVLQAHRTDMAKSTHSLKLDIISETEKLDDLDLKIESTQEQSNILDNKNKGTDNLYRQEKEALDQALEVHQRECDAMNQQLHSLRDTSRDEKHIVSINRRIVECKSKRDAQRMEHHRFINELMAAIFDAVSLCAAHREMVQDRVVYLKSKFADKLSMYLGEERLNAVRNESAQQQPQQQHHAASSSTPLKSISSGSGMDITPNNDKQSGNMGSSPDNSFMPSAFEASTLLSQSMTATGSKKLPMNPRLFVKSNRDSTTTTHNLNSSENLNSNNESFCKKMINDSDMAIELQDM